MKHLIVIRHGILRTIYTDKLPLQRLGRLTISRASNVEWSDEGQGWTVQLSSGEYLRDPIDGSIMTWQHRAEALDAEVAAVNARL